LRNYTRTVPLGAYSLVGLPPTIGRRLSLTVGLGEYTLGGYAPQLLPVRYVDQVVGEFLAPSHLAVSNRTSGVIG
jgi:hypothetical protein